MQIIKLKFQSIIHFKSIVQISRVKVPLKKTHQILRMMRYRTKEKFLRTKLRSVRLTFCMASFKETRQLKWNENYHSIIFHKKIKQLINNVQLFNIQMHRDLISALYLRLIIRILHKLKMKKIINKMISH